MKILLLALTLMVLAVPVYPQPTEGGEDASFETERNRIQAARSQEEVRYAGEEAACYRKFAVNSCLNEVRVRRRETMADLRRQEISLNDEERKRKAADQLTRIEERSSPQALQEAADRRMEALKAQQERQQRADEKVQGRIDAASKEAAALQEHEEGAARRAEAAAQRGSKAASVAEEQKKYDEKQREAQERKASRAKSLAENPDPPAKPLPVPN